MIRIVDTIDMNEHESTYQRNLYPSFINESPLEYENIFDGKIDYSVHIHTTHDRNIKFSEVFNHYGYVYSKDKTVVSLYIDEKNVHLFYTNKVLVKEYTDAIKKCIIMFLREKNLDEL